MKKFLNGLLLGSPEGPDIIIDCKEQKITLLNFPPWLSRWILARVHFI